MPEKLKVVLVDNDADELYFMEKGFDSSGLFEVLAALPDASELFSFLTGSRVAPDVVITDLNLDAKSGLEIVREIASNPRFEGIRVIVLSITSGDDNGPEMSGTALFFPKPDSLLHYDDFALGLYERIHTDSINDRASAP
jgi:CheY-like chemotaxis protein